MPRQLPCPDVRADERVLGRKPLGQTPIFRDLLPTPRMGRRLYCREPLVIRLNAVKSEPLRSCPSCDPEDNGVRWTFENNFIYSTILLKKSVKLSVISKTKRAKYLKIFLALVTRNTENMDPKTNSSTPV